jgi:hypothetical protein
MNPLVIDGAGHVAAIIARLLLDAGHQVTMLERVLVANAYGPRLGGQIRGSCGLALCTDLTLAG